MGKLFSFSLPASCLLSVILCFRLSDISFNKEIRKIPLYFHAAALTTQNIGALNRSPGPQDIHHCPVLEKGHVLETSGYFTSDLHIRSVSIWIIKPDFLLTVEFGIGVSFGSTNNDHDQRLGLQWGICLILEGACCLMGCYRVGLCHRVGLRPSMDMRLQDLRYLPQRLKRPRHRCQLAMWLSHQHRCRCPLTCQLMQSLFYPYVVLATIIHFANMSHHTSHNRLAYRALLP